MKYLLALNWKQGRTTRTTLPSADSIQIGTQNLPDQEVNSPVCQFGQFSQSTRASVHLHALLRSTFSSSKQFTLLVNSLHYHLDVRFLWVSPKIRPPRKYRRRVVVMSRCRLTILFKLKMYTVTPSMHVFCLPLLCFVDRGEGRGGS